MIGNTQRCPQIQCGDRGESRSFGYCSQSSSFPPDGFPYSVMGRQEVDSLDFSMEVFHHTFTQVNKHLDCWNLHSSAFPSYTALQCSAVHCTALHCTALHCTALHCTTLHYTALHCTALHCTALHCTALHCTTLQCTALHCTIMHRNALHCTALQYCSGLHCTAQDCSVCKTVQKCRFHYTTVHCSAV